MSPSGYPGSLDSLSTSNANATTALNTHPALHNDANDAVNKIEAELGIDPSGAAATVKARLDALTTTVVHAGNLGATETVDMTGKTYVHYHGTLDANCAVTITNLTDGARVDFFFTQDGTGGRTVTLNDGGGAVACSVDPAASATTKVECTYNGTDLLFEAPGSPLLAWTISVPIFTTPATQTNWSTIAVNAAFVHNACLQTTVQNGEVGFDVVLAVGTWSISLLSSFGSGQGIITFTLDGTSVGTLDQYTAGTTHNTLSDITGIAVATSGKKRLLLKMLTKNASASGYGTNLNALTLRRTA